MSSWFILTRVTVTSYYTAKMWTQRELVFTDGRNKITNYGIYIDKYLTSMVEMGKVREPNFLKYSNSCEVYDCRRPGMICSYQLI